MMACTPSIEPGIHVTVIDAATGIPLEATVTIQEGDYREELQLWGILAEGQVVYGGAFERPGSYTVEVVRSGYLSSMVDGVEVVQGECHVETQSLQIGLNPLISP